MSACVHYGIALLTLWLAMHSSAQIRSGSITFSGSMTHADYERLLEREFVVGDGIHRLKIIEIVNGEVVEGKFAGWPLWVKMLKAGLHLTAIGGSDDHTADETADRAVGRPATVVYARELSEPALLEGLRKG